MEEFRPEIAFVDVAMPGMDGYEVDHHLVKPTNIEALHQLLTGVAPR